MAIRYIPAVQRHGAFPALTNDVSTKFQAAGFLLRINILKMKRRSLKHICVQNNIPPKYICSAEKSRSVDTYIHVYRQCGDGYTYTHIGNADIGYVTVLSPLHISK